MVDEPVRPGIPCLCAKQTGAWSVASHPGQTGRPNCRSFWNGDLLDLGASIVCLLLFGLLLCPSVCFISLSIVNLMGSGY